jgi:hypothetical protein
MVAPLNPTIHTKQHAQHTGVFDSCGTIRCVAVLGWCPFDTAPARQGIHAFAACPVPLLAAVTRPFEVLQSKRIPEDMKAVFSNAVTAVMQERLVSWLLQQGFAAAGQKHSVSLHLVHCSTNTGYAMSLTKQQG